MLATSLLAGSTLAALAVTGLLIPPAFSRVTAMAALLLSALAMIRLFRNTAQGRGHIIRAQAPGDLLRYVLTAACLTGATIFRLSINPTDYVTIALVVAAVTASFPYLTRAAVAIRKGRYQVRRSYEPGCGMLVVTPRLAKLRFLDKIGQAKRLTKLSLEPAHHCGQVRGFLSRVLISHLSHHPPRTTPDPY